MLGERNDPEYWLPHQISWHYHSIQVTTTSQDATKVNINLDPGLISMVKARTIQVLHCPTAPGWLKGRMSVVLGHTVKPTAVQWTILKNVYCVHSHQVIIAKYNTVGDGRGVRVSLHLMIYHKYIHTYIHTYIHVQHKYVYTVCPNKWLQLWMCVYATIMGLL